jgi:ParB-like chromosome segregation protein Spo0J
MDTETVPLSQIVTSRQAWPRDNGDADRVEMFAGLLDADQYIPPPEVVDLGDGRWLLADGVHRVEAHRQLGRSEIDVVVVPIHDGETSVQAAYRRALETATLSALPLTKAERRRAVYRLLDERSELSHRAVARLVGVSHQTVDRWAVERGRHEAGEPAQDVVVERRVSVDDVARRFVRYAGQLNEARGLLDLVANGRMSKHLAEAFVDKFGDDAARQAKRCAEWFAAAARRLVEDGST